MLKRMAIQGETRVNPSCKKHTRDGIESLYLF